nr:unnamed protein product [Callosobruchus chinensis]
MMGSLSLNDLTDTDIEYVYKTGSAELLSKWLTSLETKSSLFWLHYLDSDFEKEKRANSLESTEGTLSDTDVDADETSEEFGSAESVTSSCRSIAHRESDLLVALSENCTLGPVCYFCR